ncbi:ParA family protein, partial [Streptococcus anginosus]|nr:ParA family protein [Streptococcus anginosus]
MKVKFEEFRGEVIDFKTRESYIKADLKLIGNMIKHNTAISHDFSNYIKGNPDFVARFPFKEIFTKSIQEKKSI